MECTYDNPASPSGAFQNAHCVISSIPLTSTDSAKFENMFHATSISMLVTIISLGIITTLLYLKK